MGFRSAPSANETREFSTDCVHPVRFIRCLTLAAGSVYYRKLWIFAASIRQGRPKFTIYLANLQKGINEESSDRFGVVAHTHRSLRAGRPASLFCRASCRMEICFQQDVCSVIQPNSPGGG